jgi:hypothetical protein
MNKLLIGLLISCNALSASAHDHRHHGHGSNDGWIAPLVIGTVIGGVLGGVASASQPRRIYQEPVYQEPIYQPREPVFREVYVFIPECNCYNRQLRQIGWR